ncbi:TetR/AcrR family transcriptional regulator [Algicella marina]|uniref:TetR family transcriptional regulator n=1 Tax=Algicella marina TaxID=2683284 RepID=A0A6P1T4A3_9RHOB|nr:TetR/AcrR family transcriptional regulator [Algicella marina]QHQ36089.1 TetR family transcriptional regulator [Algicella marina]
MSDTKKLGRPRNFDYDTALLSAMKVFWEKGYDGASLRDLTSAMGITGPSLYAAFGDKSELYLKTIDHYASADACTPLVALEREEDIAEALHAFLSEVIRSATDHASGAKGCYIASSVVAVAGQVQGVSERVQAVITEAENRLTARFQKEVDKGTLPPGFPARARAAMLFDLRQGYMFRGRAGWSNEQMMKDVPDRVRMLLAE